MTYDINGDELHVGDIITLDFVIESIKSTDSSPLPDKCNLRHINSDSYQWLREVNTSYCTKKSSKPNTVFNDDCGVNPLVIDGYNKINTMLYHSDPTPKGAEDTFVTGIYPLSIDDSQYCPNCGEFINASHICDDTQD